MYDWPQALWVVPSDWRCVASLLSCSCHVVVVLVVSATDLCCSNASTSAMRHHHGVARLGGNGLLMSVSVGASHLWRVGVGWR
jgi:hypothetical protein